MGFHRVETLPRFGGEWYRRSAPYSPSREHGLAYESWEAPGFVSRDDVVSWVGKGRSTRLDVTADFPGLSLRPVEIRDMLTSGKLETTCEKVTLVDSGNDGQTLYLGSNKSPRRIRIYEKGLQLGNQEDLLRVEVTLKEDLAADAFAALGDPGEYHSWLGGHWRSHLVKVVNGPLVETWTKELPSAELRTHADDLDPWRTVQAIARQYGSILWELHNAGVLVEWVMAMAEGSRWSKRRAEKVVGVVASDLDKLMHIAKSRCEVSQ